MIAQHIKPSLESIKVSQLQPYHLQEFMPKSSQSRN
ncbi:hypothetical protein COJ85_05120 [Bacillus sp. AFS076308]|nr:hypothetical protein COJ85_05120 [Bacillus sp. AFS076308]PGV51455.1 hypothetical protein COD92_13815 [Bacillus sp. AFS037270]